MSPSPATLPSPASSAAVSSSAVLEAGYQGPTRETSRTSQWRQNNPDKEQAILETSKARRQEPAIREKKRWRQNKREKEKEMNAKRLLLLRELRRRELELHLEKQRELERVQRQQSPSVFAQGGGTVLDEVQMSAVRGRLADERLERRREPPPLQPCWRGAASHAGGAGLICRRGSRWHHRCDFNHGRA